MCLVVLLITIYRIMHALTYVTWLVFRGLLPIYLLVVVWTKIVQQLDEVSTLGTGRNLCWS